MLTASPPKTISPESKPWIPATHLMRVVLPAPLSPTSAITSPSRTSKSTSVSACTDPYDFVIPRSWRSGGVSLTQAFPTHGTVGGAPPGASTVPSDDYLQYFLNSPTQTWLRLSQPSVKSRL